MTSRVRAIGAAIAVLLLACDRPAGGSATRTPAGALPATGPESGAFLSADGVGATREEATAAARAALLTTLLGDPRWGALTKLELDHPDLIATEAPAPHGSVRVHLQLSRVGAAALLSAFEDSELEIVGPSPWRDVIYAYLRAHVAAHACEERRRLFSATCETGDTAEVDDALAELTTEVELSPPFPDGIPADREGRMLRPASVYVLWRGLPIADVPVIATSAAGQGERQATSDGRGVAVVAPAAGADWSTLDVRVNAAALLGPRQGAWPDRAVQLKARPVDAQRWALIVAQADSELAAAVTTRMKEDGATEPAAVATATATAITSAEGEARGRRITALADASSGRIDLLLVASAESRFAGRMGSSKSWAEASGRVQVYDAWTGRVVASVEETATASGVGDDRASRAARQKLATTLAERLLAAPELRFSAR